MQPLQRMCTRIRGGLRDEKGVVFLSHPAVLIQVCFCRVFRLPRVLNVHL